MRAPPPPWSSRRATRWLASVVCAAATAAALASLAGCDDKKPAATEATAAPAKQASAAPEPAKPPPDTVPSVAVDAKSIYLGGEKLDLTAPDPSGRLKALLGKFKLDGKSVAVTALRTARTPDVAMTVAAIGDAGATDITLRTLDRSRKDTELKLTPEKRVGKLPDCTVVTMVERARFTSSWQLRGGGTLKYAKGMAGPDLTQTLEGITRQINGCASTALVFSGEDSVEWGLTFDLVTKVSTAQPPLKTVTYVLPRESLAAGRAVKLGGLVLHRGYASVPGGNFPRHRPPRRARDDLDLPR
jgi:hypothetical protein